MLKILMPPHFVYQRIKLLRLFSGLSQVDMAKMLRGSQAWLSKVEAGKLEISAENLFQLRSIFNISADVILDGEVPYYKVALRMNREILIPAHYTQHPQFHLEVLYPFIKSLFLQKNKKALTQALHRLEVSSIIFSDDKLMVNEQFVGDFLRSKSVFEYFQAKSSFDQLKKLLAKAGSSHQPSDVQFYNEKFIQAFLNSLVAKESKRSPVTGLSAGPAASPVFRAKELNNG